MDSGLIKPNSVHTFIASPDEDVTRLDKFITKQFPFYSRSYFQQLIEDGLVTVNEVTQKKSSTTLKPNDIITVRFPKEREVSTELISSQATGIELIHEDTHFLVFAKPAGLSVHPAHARSTEISLVDYLKTNYQDIALVGYVDRPGIVHRLDKDTSGLIIIARTNYAHTVFGKKFHDRTIHKTYHAFVHGHPAPTGTIDFAIGRDPHVPVKMRAFNAHEASHTSTKVRHATSHFRVLAYFENHALVEIKPITGRTHQIRVHLAAIGHPIVGDSVYGTSSKLIARHALHAHALTFEFENKSHTFTKEMPHDMQQLMQHFATK